MNYNKKGGRKMATSRNFDLFSYVDESNLGVTSPHVKHNKYTQYLENELAKPKNANA